MVRRVPRRDFRSGRTACMRLTLEPSSRMVKTASGLPALALRHPRRYVACIVSFFGFQSSPFFHRRRVTDAILRARVTFASSSFTPRASEAS